jgi:hypothetical protein
MIGEYDIDLGDLHPGFTAAACEEESALCWECGKDEAQAGNHCFDCAGEMICEELGLPERLAA